VEEVEPELGVFDIEPLLWPLAEPWALVSVPVLLVEAWLLFGVLVPAEFDALVSAEALACVPLAPPAVPCVPEIDPDCVMPVSFPAVRVFLLLELQPKMSAAASANGNENFMCEPPQGVVVAL
jgi:hypothetical protein